MRRIAIFQITKAGLGAISVLVLVLWGCLAAEHSLLRQSRMEQYRVMRDIRQLKLRRVMEPASHPVPFRPPTPRQVQG
jgi:hypothetical protein